MLEIPALDVVTAMKLRARFRDRTNTDLLFLNASAWQWVSERVYDAYLEPTPHPLLVTAAFFRIMHLCEKDAKAKSAYLFAAHELTSAFG